MPYRYIFVEPTDRFLIDVRGQEQRFVDISRGSIVANKKDVIDAKAQRDDASERIDEFCEVLQNIAAKKLPSAPKAAIPASPAAPSAAKRAAASALERAPQRQPSPQPTAEEEVPIPQRPAPRPPTEEDIPVPLGPPPAPPITEEEAAAMGSHTTASTGDVLSELVAPGQRIPPLVPKEVHEEKIAPSSEVEMQTLRFALIGDKGIGKASLLLRFTSGKFLEHFAQPIGGFGGSKAMRIGGEMVKLNIKVPQGRNSVETFTDAKFSNVILLVFDTTNRDSFESIKRLWAQECQQLFSENVLYVLVGSKSDLANERKVTATDAREYAEAQGWDYVETNAKNGAGVQEAFTQAAQKILARTALVAAEQKQPATPKQNIQDFMRQFAAEIKKPDIKTPLRQKEMYNLRVKAMGALEDQISHDINARAKPFKELIALVKKFQKEDIFRKDFGLPETKKHVKELQERLDELIDRAKTVQREDAELAKTMHMPPPR